MITSLFPLLVVITISECSFDGLSGGVIALGGEGS